MPAGLFASLAGAACGPMRKVCPVRRLPLQPALRLRLGRDVSGTRMLLPGPSMQRPPVPVASIAPPLPPPAPGTGQDSASVPSVSRPPPPCRCSPILSRQHGSRAPFLRPAPALSRFIHHPLSPVRTSRGRRIPPGSPKAKDCALNQHFSSHPGTFVQRKMIL